ncbi:MAG: 4Fe-4S dicluster domain-containing protein [Desulfobacterales bacterium]|nr:4Fe-4S dicluster domain-containing protein [Desulfobacterales bacterium]
MRESTKTMRRKHGWRLDRFVHNYLYFLFYYPYVRLVYSLLPALKYLAWFKPIVPIGKMTFDRYHSKVLSAGDTKKIFTLNADISAISKENKSIIPYKYATKIIFQEPEFIAVMDCPCKKSAHAPLADINSCIAVGKGLASFWLDHCAKYNARKITQTEALDVIQNLRKKGHITQAFFKVATGGSTGVICNCHPDTCANLQATMLSSQVDKALSMTARSGYSVICDPRKCINCGRCMDACNFGALDFTGDVRHYSSETCLGCELCVENCPEKALSLYTDPSKPLPLDLDKIKARAPA